MSSHPSEESMLDTIAKHAKEDDRLAGLLAYDMLNGQRQRTAKRLWKLVYILVLLCLISVLLNIYAMTHTSIYPIVVKVNGNNQILDIEKAVQLDDHSLTPEMQTYLIEKFVINARSVSVDGQLGQYLIKAAYAFTQGEASQTLQQFVVQRAPFSMAATQVISVQIDSVTPYVGGSRHTTQIIWTEIARDTTTARLISKKRYTGQFTFKQAKVPAKDGAILLYNPMGFYITHISWTQNFESLSEEVPQ